LLRKVYNAAGESGEISLLNSLYRTKRVVLWRLVLHLAHKEPLSDLLSEYTFIYAELNSRASYFEKNDAEKCDIFLLLMAGVAVFAQFWPFFA
jgi:hypothetical protein